MRAAVPAYSSKRAGEFSEMGTVCAHFSFACATDAILVFSLPPEVGYRKRDEPRLCHRLLPNRPSVTS